MAGWYLILLALFVTLFAYVFIPDNTPLANRMNLSISNQKPGFKVEMLKIPKPYYQSPGLMERIFFGRNDDCDFIPLSTYRIADNFIFYSEFTGEDEAGAVQEKKVLLSRLGIKEGEKDLQLNKYIVTKTFIFGTDRYGRDMFSRIVAGTRVTFSVGFVAVIISLFVGLFFGSLAGYFRGKVDGVILWIINVIWSVPTLLLVISISLVLGKGFSQIFIAVGLTMWVDVARIVRSQLFSIRELEFIAAGKALGFRSWRIIALHMLPNVIGPVLVVAASNFSTAILLEAGLSFLGIGAQPPTPSWGSMIKENYGYIIIHGSAYLALLPGIAIMLLTMAFTFVANGLRDAVDSKTQVTLV